MPTFYWRGATNSGPTGQFWGVTANWLNASFGGATVFPRGGDTAIFGASAISCCLLGGLSGGYWLGYTEGDQNSSTDMVVVILPGYGTTHPNNTTQLGYSFASTEVPGRLQLKVSGLYVGTTHNAEISINNIPATNYSLAHVDSPKATFYTSGTWKNIIVNQGSINTKDLQAELILIEGLRGNTYYHVATQGYGVNKVQIDSPSNINSVVISAKSTAEPVTINATIKTPVINAMGLTANLTDSITPQQNFRPAGMERTFNRITRTLRYDRS